MSNLLSNLIENTNKEKDLLLGICSIDNPLLDSFQDNINKILPSAKSLIVIIASHSKGALNSDNNQVKQYDTIYTYERVKEISMKLTRDLEFEGYNSAAVPAFIPLDIMSEKRGMKGEICWRTASVASGLGKIGKNNLLITEPFGSRVRIGGLITEHPPINTKSENTQLLKHPKCDSCDNCQKNCPTKALSNYSTNKKLCGDYIFSYGLRKYSDQMEKIINANQEERKKLLRDGTTRELWQNFMTGCYYYCWKCQVSCPN